MTAPRKPAGLKAAGTRLWDAVNAEFDLEAEPHKVELLTQACRTTDVIARLQRVVDTTEDLRVRGSQGQPVSIPELAELRQYRALLAQLMGRLGLPDTDEAIAEKAEKLSMTRAQSARSVHLRLAP